VREDCDHMETKQILNEIESAGAWLRLVTMRHAFDQRDTLTPVFLDAVQQRAAAKVDSDIQLQRVATFGLFFLAQHRERRVLEPMIRLLDSVESGVQDEWLFTARILYFGPRLIAGACPLDAQTPTNLALDSKLKPTTRGTVLCAIIMLAANGDITRAEAIVRFRQLFKPVQNLQQSSVAIWWVRAAAKLDAILFAHEIEWFLQSGLLTGNEQSYISEARQLDRQTLFASIALVEPPIDMTTNVFPQDMRHGEIGFIPNGQIPNLQCCIISGREFEQESSS